MKKISAVILMVILAIGMISCAKKDVTQSETPDATSNTAEIKKQGKVLIAYFSWSGHTKELAELVKEETNGELFEIQPKVPYTSNYNDLLKVAKKELSEDTRPEIKNKVTNMKQYDTIYIGYPIWWADVPRIVLTFLENNDLSGKTVVPFCTNGGSKFGKSLSTIKKVAKGATVAEGLEVYGENVSTAKEDVKSWIAKIHSK